MKKPNSFAEFLFLKQTSLAQYHHCVECEEPFTPSNVYSADGWKETQISGLCEDCFDTIEEDEQQQDSITDMAIKDKKEEAF